jgi:hypothetical protein
MCGRIISLRLLNLAQPDRPGSLPGRPPSVLCRDEFVITENYVDNFGT